LHGDHAERAGSLFNDAAPDCPGLRFAARIQGAVESSPRHDGCPTSDTTAAASSSRPTLVVALNGIICSSSTWSYTAIS
jgi:hypothetical protein